MDKQKLTIVILNYNGKEETIECLNSLNRVITDHELNILIVDNASVDGSSQIIKNLFPNTRLIQNQKNLGFSEGNNIGIRKALSDGADFILLLNNDTVAGQDFIDNLFAFTNKDKKTLLSPKIYFFPGYEFHKDRYKKEELGKVIWYAGGKIDWDNIMTSHKGVDEVDRGQFDKIEETDFVTGCAMLVHRVVFEKIGLLDPTFFAYFEDADFSLRAKKAGFKLIYYPKASIWHKNAASFAGSGSNFQDYFITRNRIIFGLRYASIRAKLALLRQSFSYLSGPNRKRQAVIDALFKRSLSQPKINTLLRG